MNTPTEAYVPLRLWDPPKLLGGLDAAVNRLHGIVHRRGAILKELLAEADEVARISDKWRDVTEGRIRARLFELRSIIRRTRSLEDKNAVHESLALLREATHQKLGLRPFPVQLAGTLALTRGYLAEMATGEGKTLTAGLAAVLFGWTGRPLHIVTVNDYLVKRDAERLSPLYHFAGTSVGSVTADLDPEARHTAYGADITYATAKEILADFLRDRLKTGHISDPSRLEIRQLIGASKPPRDNHILRGLHTAIVDEADSVLIDEAVTPLIISARKANESLQSATERAASISESFERETHYQLDPQYKEIRFTSGGREMIRSLRDRFPGLWKSPQRAEELLQLAIQSREFYLRGKQYIVEDGKIVIVDEFTGRPMPGRSWQQGVHQAVEAKEGIEITQPAETVARKSFQQFFRLYRKLSGMTGTARETADELWQTYSLPVITIPTNRPCIRHQGPDRYFATEEGKWSAIVDEIKTIHATGQPILAGTRSVTSSEKLAELLAADHIPCRVLNATKLAEEAATIRLAGECDHVTIATNMAGRGTDIMLGPGVPEFGGLHVIATERHESGRIDRQLYGRSARQGDPGSAQAFVSLEDELPARYLSMPARWLLRGLFNSPLPFRRHLLAALIRRAQHSATKRAESQRRSVVRKDSELARSLSFAGNDN